MIVIVLGVVLVLGICLIGEREWPSTRNYCWCVEKRRGQCS